jgi:ATP adenylyltransferase
MVAPLRHMGDLEGLPPEELGDLLVVTKKAVSLLKRALSPQGFNIGMNVGQVAGAGIVDHLHIHVVPRWGGDTNFMPIIGNTIVVPEYIEATYQKLISALEEMAREG